MMKIFAVLLVSFLSLSFMQPNDDTSANSPSPEGDVRMGADVTTSGTDISDKEMQAQQEGNDEEEQMRKDDLTEEERTSIDAK
ncbi:MAG: hypothetical protein H0V66_12460 [Bdellovibrionales bacterium]|nr:hypothetical protein [Bdellovibrionales bacterium]